jgi:hypothetical protein
MRHALCSMRIGVSQLNFLNSLEAEFSTTVYSAQFHPQ